jgi:hypothetical protein
MVAPDGFPIRPGPAIGGCFRAVGRDLAYDIHRIALPASLI